jgi:hypothetical protein
MFSLLAVHLSKTICNMFMTQVLRLSEEEGVLQERAKLGGRGVDSAILSGTHGA